MSQSSPIAAARQEVPLTESTSPASTTVGPPSLQEISGTLTSNQLSEHAAFGLKFATMSAGPSVASINKPETTTGTFSGRSCVAVDGAFDATTLRVEPAVVGMQAKEREAPERAAQRMKAGASKAGRGASKWNRTRPPMGCRRIDLDEPGFLRLDDVLALIPVSRATWYAGVKAGDYPAQVQIGKRLVAWKTADIKSLVEKLAAATIRQKR